MREGGRKEDRRGNCGEGGAAGSREGLWMSVRLTRPGVHNTGAAYRIEWLSVGVQDRQCD